MVGPLGPVFEGNRVTTFMEVQGLGDYLPKYAGNLDIMTAAAAKVGDRVMVVPLVSGHEDEADMGYERTGVGQLDHQLRPPADGDVLSG